MDEMMERKLVVGLVKKILVAMKIEGIHEGVTEGL